VKDSAVHDTIATSAQGSSVVERLRKLFRAHGLAVIGAAVALVVLAATAALARRMRSTLPANVVRLDGAVVTLSNAQHAGARRGQEDAFGFSDIKDRELLAAVGVLGIVADGMGGLELGAQASNTAVRAFLNTFPSQALKSSIPSAMRTALDSANQAVVALASNSHLESRIGTTFAAVAVGPAGVQWIAAGDTRIYLYRRGRLSQLNADHSFHRLAVREAAVGRAFPAGTPNEQRHAVTSFLGVHKIQEIDQSLHPVPLEYGDRIILCTDGLYGSVSEERMARLLSEEAGQVLTEHLVSLAVADGKKNQDNVTVISFAFDRYTTGAAGQREPAQPRPSAAPAVTSRV